MKFTDDPLVPAFFIQIPKISKYIITNPFHATGLFLHPLKTSEKQRFSVVFWGYRKSPVANLWVNSSWRPSERSLRSRDVMKKSNELSGNHMSILHEILGVKNNLRFCTNYFTNTLETEHGLMHGVIH